MIKAKSCLKFVPKFSINSSARLCPSCPNEPNVRNKSKSARDGPSVRNKGRAVRTVRLSERCPSDIWGFVRPKAEPRLFCPSRAELSENPNVRMSTPDNEAYSPKSPAKINRKGEFGRWSLVEEVCRAGHDEDPQCLKKERNQETQRLIVVLFHTSISAFESSTEEINTKSQCPDDNKKTLKVKN